MPMKFLCTIVTTYGAVPTLNTEKGQEILKKFYLFYSELFFVLNLERRRKFQFLVVTVV